MTTNETLIEELKPTEEGWTDMIQQLVEGGAMNSKVMRATPHNVEVGTVVFDTLIPKLRKLFLSAIQAKERDMIEKFKEIIGEDEDEFEVGFYKGEMIGRVRKTGEEIPLRMELKQADRNELRAYLRSKLSNLSDK